MKKILLLLTVAFVFFNAHAQITFTKNDLATAGDTFRISNAAGLGINNVASTGPNMTWDYSNLVALTQTVDTFVTVGSTPILYQLYFNNQFIYPNTKATVATKINVPTLPAGAPITLTNGYGFYKAATAAYSQVGFGATISGLPTSIPYDSLDYIYRFPMNYGNIDSCRYKFQLSLPTIGYLRRRAKRVNEVDGWGTLITPFGTFNTLRVKSTTYAVDTIFITQLNFGTQIVQQPTVEYKWVGTNSGIPYLVVNASADSIPVISSVRYQDSLRQVISIGVNSIENPISEFNITPNPTNALSILTFSQKQSGKLSIEILDVSGKLIRKVFEGDKSAGINAIPLDLSEQKAGLYLVRIKNETSTITKKISRL